MEEIINFIFSNFIIVLIIIGGLAKLLGGDNKEQQEKHTKRTPSPIETKQQTTTSREYTAEKYKQRPINDNATPNQVGEDSSIGEAISIGEQQQKQLEQLAGKMKTEAIQDFDNLSNQADNEHRIMTTSLSKGLNEKASVNFNNKPKKEVKKQMQNRLSRKGLIESVIMAEILGPPRARKPYKSVITERNNR